MKKLALVTLMAALVAPIGARAELPTPDKKSLDYYLQEHKQFPSSQGEPLDSWEDALVAALGKSDPDTAADGLGRRFGLSGPQMRELVRLWLYTHANLTNMDRTPQQRSELTERFVALATASQHAPLVLEAAAASVFHESDCGDGSTLQPLLAGSAHPAEDAWRIAVAGGTCAPLYATFARTAPDRALPALLEAATENWLSASDALPLLAYFTSPPALARIDAEHREAAAKYLTHLYLATLLRAGLGDRAIGLYDSLTPDWKAAMLAESPQVAVTADGFPSVIGGKVDGVGTALAAAYALAGRNADAEAFLGGSKELIAARRLLDCSFATGGMVRPPNAERCDSSQNNALGLVLLDDFLHHPADDPYPIAEVFYGGGTFVGSEEGALAELACRVFAEERFAALCQAGRDNTRSFIVDAPGNANDEAAGRAVIAAAHIPGYDESRAAFASQLAAAIARGRDDAEERRSFRERPAVDPEVPAFAALPIPEPMKGHGPAPVWSKSFAALPQGYEPVRVTRDGNRIAVVSVSQNYDPTGEVSRGGYWIHLSEDGGRSWQRPLYTGLADRFPYVVVPNPRLPLFDGDVLNLAVEVRELDTRSISYPPVSLATRRSQDNLYLRIPIADLKRDSDGDGLTDLAARHLLLTGSGAASSGPTPFVVGRAGPGSCKAGDAVELGAMQAVLQHIFSVRTGALIEPVDRDPAHPLEGALGIGIADPNSVDRPILVEGDPSDYACLRPDRLMIVYSAADLERVRRMTPDFHAVKLDKVIYNRVRDRGYIVWSSGWTGGTLRLRRVGSEWKLEPISSWIT